MLSTITISGTWKGGYRTDIKAGDHLVIVDQPESGGGKNEGPNPLEFELIALGSCLGTIAAIIARQERIGLNGFSFEINGDVDKAYLMGKTKEGRAGFTDIRVKINIDADMTDEEKQAFFNRVDERCPVSDNLINKTNVVFEVV